MAVEDTANAGELKALKAELSQQHIKKLNALRAQETEARAKKLAARKTRKKAPRKLAIRFRKRRLARGKADGGQPDGKKARVDSTPVPEALPPLPAPPTPPLGAASGDALPIDDAPSASTGVCEAIVPVSDEPRWASEKIYTTPEVIKTLLPSLPGCSLTMDQVACRYRARAHYVHFGSVGFGPAAGLTRYDALKVAVDLVWANVSEARPSHAEPDTVPWRVWGGIMGARDEKPRRFVR